MNKAACYVVIVALFVAWAATAAVAVRYARVMDNALEHMRQGRYAKAASVLRGRKERRTGNVEGY